ncbi:MAG: hypothetical protein ABJF04_25730 [Reichenbachiella sp.]|uniref:hypothetical protein n=1 Tax=Reichenbachiella sp. TaxID=2184521 RepID=UPI003264D427
MKINKDTTLRDLERFFDNSELEMELTATSEFNPTVLASLIQCLLTKIRNYSDIRIKLYIDPSEIRNVLRFHYQYFYLISVCLFSRDFKMLDKNDREIDLNSLAYGFIKGRQVQEFLYTQSRSKKLPFNSKISKTDLDDFDKHFLGKSKGQRGVSFGIACFDHETRDDLSWSRYLGTTTETKSGKHLSSWLERFFDSNKIKMGNSLSNDTSISDVSSVVHELFDNTNQWAKTTFDSKSYYFPNYRGCIMNLYLQDQLGNGFSSFEPTVNQYLNNLASHEIGTLEFSQSQSELFSNDKLGLVEISIIDTGPGMARRILAKDYSEMNEEEEANGVIQCFQKYMTSDSTGTRTVRGRGLSKVVELIGKTGLIRVRSGRTEIIRNFLTTPYGSNDTSRGLRFTNKLSLNPFEGTCISILYPFKYRDR